MGFSREEYDFKTMERGGNDKERVKFRESCALGVLVVLRRISAGWPALKVASCFVLNFGTPHFLCQLVGHPAETPLQGLS